MMNLTSTSAQQSAQKHAALALAEAIRALGSVPSGHLYARVMGALSLEAYQSLIRSLVSAGLVRNSSHMLTWIGPLASDASPAVVVDTPVATAPKPAKPASARITLECNECGKVFRIGARNLDPECPKCGGSDYDVR
jgi:hypothetical protein